ncbi:hypothetical protein IAU59_004508 [Kwoniella sp. CBS 9459]
MIREANFYQEAYEASHAYIANIGTQLTTRYGFRVLEERDVAIHHPFATTSSTRPFLLNLISSTPSPTTHAQIHIVQLPAELSALLNDYDTSAINPHAMGHPRLTTFSTVLTPTACHITQSTLELPPLNDLISFLQCMLPSATALALTASSCTSAHDDPETMIKRQPDVDFGSAKSEDLEDVLQTPRLAADGQPTERDTISRIDRWRLTSTGVADQLAVDKSAFQAERGLEDKSVEIATVVEVEEIRSRMSTPNPQWLDKNEDLLRDTVGCSYFRRLKELAIAERAQRSG